MNFTAREAEQVQRGKERGDIVERGEGFIGCCAVPTAICLFINYLASKAKRTADECWKEGGQGAGVWHALVLARILTVN